jgi:flagellar hook-associated protein 3 FlgL
MRISTQTFYDRSVSAMQDQQAALSKIQHQVATGQRVSTPADDPIAMVHILELERAKAESDQYGKNSDVARSRLNLEEQAMEDVGLVVQRVRELLVQASNIGGMSPSDRQSLGVELASRLDELQDIANRKDGNGEYMFSGFSTLTQPFARDAAGVITYSGDQGNRLVQVGPSQRIADGHSGNDVFMNVTAGNGTFTTGVTSTNTGSGTITVGQVNDSAAWVPDDYTLVFDNPPTTWQVLDGGGVQVATGAYTAGNAIAFNGVQVAVSGVPAAGDSFAIAQSTTEDMFTTVQKIVTALNGPSGSAASNAQLSTVLGASLQQLDQITDHALGVRAQIGARLSSLDDADATRDSLSVDLQTSLADLRDLDYAEALTRMNQQLVGLQAAQLSYTKISQLSLFNYLS